MVGPLVGTTGWLVQRPHRTTQYFVDETTNQNLLVAALELQGKGAGCQRNLFCPAEGEVFSLDIPFYRITPRPPSTTLKRGWDDLEGWLKNIQVEYACHGNSVRIFKRRLNAHSALTIGERVYLNDLIVSILPVKQVFHR